MNRCVSATETHGIRNTSSLREDLSQRPCSNLRAKTEVQDKLVALIRDCVHPHPKPAIYIGGGIDSAIILHHLQEKANEEIYTYTFGFEGEPNEFQAARRVAEHYGTRHQEVVIGELLPTYPEILKHLSKPRFSIWVYWVAEKAHEDGREICYVGEGGDEHFGGYWYKPRQSYLESWVGLFQWGIPTYKAVHDIFGLRFEAPFLKLDWRETYPYYDYEQHKFFLRKAYKGILPDFVLDRKKNPARRNYRLFWEKELKQHFATLNPTSDEEIRELWQIWVTQEWLRLHTP